MVENYIKINGAREHNLKNISVDIPHGKHTVITGVSGSGKSTLAYDVIYATGQKRLFDCFSEQSKLLTNQLKQPDVNYIKGLTPVISMKQYEPRKNPRATIGTLCDASTYLRYLYALVGQARCPFCNRIYPVRALHYLVKELESLPESTTVELQFPVYKSKNKSYDAFFAELRNKGYKRIEIDGERKNFRDWINIEKQPKTMMLIEDSIQIQGELTKSNIHSIQKALQEGDGFLRVVIPDATQRERCGAFFQKHGCIDHGMVSADIQPSFFSFNDLRSGCFDCHGTGTQKSVYPATLIQNKKKSLKQGPFFSEVYNSKQPLKHVTLFSLAKHYNFSFEAPFDNLPEFAKDLIFYGTKGEKFVLSTPDGYDKELPKYSAKVGDSVEFEGIVNWVNRYYQERLSVEVTDAEQAFFNRFMVDEVCGSCHGTRLKPQRAFITIRDNTYFDLGNFEIIDLMNFLDDLELSVGKTEAIRSVIHEIKLRLNSLIKIGLGYLSLNRRADTLSGGEYQRVRLARQIGTDLMGLTYIIDEPTVGLHAADNARIIEILDDLCQQGNTVITIEHDLDIIKHADHIIEIGPGAGVNGGKIVAIGSVDEIIKNKKSINAPFLKPRKVEPRVKVSSLGRHDFIRIIGAQANNLKNIDVSIPLNSLVCLTGVSGSGKSSLAIEIIYKAFWSSFHDSRVIPGKHTKIEGMEKIKDVYCIDQSSMGRSAKSTPATYIGVFDRIRILFSECEDAIKYDLNDASYYSFNAMGGCHSCKGKGYIDTHIHYLGSLETICSECNGSRYTSQVLEVLYKGKNIKQVLDLDFKTALSFFAEDKYIYNRLKYVCDLGLDYMTLGQPNNTISGGEAQRLCLAKEISKIRGKKNMLYIIDEPTTGLHPQDIENVMNVMKSIVEKGNSMLIIEHNPDVIINADHIIDVGPEAGRGGGEIVVSGSLEEIMACSRSKTGQYLTSYLNNV